MYTETVTLEGHIIDSRKLPELLDDIVAAGGAFEILDVHIGRTQTERSHARIEMRGETNDQMQRLLELAEKHGAIVHVTDDADIQTADMDGAFPEDFYSTTNQPTLVRHEGEWLTVEDQEMDCAVRHVPGTQTFRCVPITQVRRGDRIVCGERGIRVRHATAMARTAFEFMSSSVSSEKPKHTLIRRAAAQMHAVRQAGRRIALVGGPAIVHTGAAEHVEELVEAGYLNLLLAGNALAVHDIERALFDTSLGVNLEIAAGVDGGHAHHLRAINAIRRCGSIRAAVENGVLTRGIMHACIENDVPYILAGSIRDDGPLPDVITDALEAQQRMREALRGVGYVLMVATMLHSVAVGNLLPASTPVLCVDISTSAVTKLSDRGSSQTQGLITDVEPFFRSLAAELRALRESEP